ncbi:transglutaminase family protein [Thermosynechococcus vestitus]|uniref:Tlr1782 protein n=1 Tax=Thermosynechococcus vestitus (strain NIES-2133 / IAM M-273 / BP-1) TaxID=197221 RepID=Q8DI10_THEVB|nr:transglutaminase family protein [Thermosynechococcus vestitus]BAC09334.1 tlr1782 [Thermosynechococcus vestitus BP-1]
MQYRICHQTTYTYSAPVALAPHDLRLIPRSDGHQRLRSLSLEILPTPQGHSSVLDVYGNHIQRYWWLPQPTTSLMIQVTSEVETYCDNPFNYLLEPWAVTLPFNYPQRLATSLHPYLSLPVDPVAYELAWQILASGDRQVLTFLSDLNNKIYRTCQHQIRETGAPWPPCVTWAKQTGSCRDTAVLFIHACRAVGLAARFVSGYQEGDLENPERHLHAWVEVYLPGAGWRGYDPTHGLAVSDRHIALVAAADPADAAPIEGVLRGQGVTSTMSYQLQIQRLS